MKEIVFAGQQLILHHESVLLWPAQKTAVVSDLHLEKASHFAKKGQMLPPHDSEETMARLLDIMEFSACDKLVLLGDTFHDRGGYDRLSPKAKTLFNEIRERYEIIWIIGNHDGAFVPEKTKPYQELDIENITFRHEAIQNNDFEISGHYHPKATLNLRGKKVSRPCYMIGKTKIIMPSFGTFTGGLDITKPPLIKIVPTPFTAHLTGPSKLYSVPSTKLKIHKTT